MTFVELDDRAGRPESRVAPTLQHHAPTLPNVRTSALLIFVLAAFAACSDNPAAPPSAARVPTAVNAKQNFSTGLATAEWNGQARTLVISHLRNPIVSARGYALLAMAQYGAVVAADANDDDDGTVAENGFGAGGRSRYEAQRGAVAGASAQVLKYLYSADADAAAVAQAVEARIVTDGAEGPGGTQPQFTRGVEVGRAWGDRLVAWGKADGFSKTIAQVPFVLKTGVGYWLPAPAPALPAGFQFPWMQPYLLTSTSQFHAPTPPAFGSAAFLTDLAEVRGYSLLSPTDPVRIEQVRIAKLRDLGVGTETGLGGWDEVAEGYIAEAGLDERSAAHVLALTNAAALDAVLGCWESKYVYDYIRPPQADPVIKTAIPLPNHPSYPSGHSCVSGAASTVLASFFPGHAADVQALMIENGNSRIYGGIHYRFDVTAGQQLGIAVGRYALEYDADPRGLLRAIP